jgi:hypothetical protein
MTPNSHAVRRSRNIVMAGYSVKQSKIKPIRRPRAGVQNSIRIIVLMEVEVYLNQMVNMHFYQFCCPV